MCLGSAYKALPVIGLEPDWSTFVLGQAERIRYAEPMEMTKENALKYLRRWDEVHQIEMDELRASTADDNFRAFSLLMEAGQDYGWQKAFVKHEDEVRRRWLRIKNAHDARESTREA